MIILFTRHCYGDQLKEDEMGGACGKKLIKKIGSKTRSQEITWDIRV